MNNLNGIFNTPDHTEEFDYNDVQNTNVVVTALTYIFFLYTIHICTKLTVC